MSIVIFPEIVSQQISVGIILVGRLGFVWSAWGSCKTKTLRFWAELLDCAFENWPDGLLRPFPVTAIFHKVEANKFKVRNRFIGYLA